MIQDKKKLGDLGEALAVELLAGEGCLILEKKYRCKVGEIDIICEFEGILIFVEVKTRQSQRFGRPAEAVTLSKQKRMRAIAAFYIQQHQRENCQVSFRVIEIFVNQIKDAF